MLMVQRASDNISRLFQGVVHRAHQECLVVRCNLEDGTHQYTKHHYGPNTYFIESGMSSLHGVDIFRLEVDTALGQNVTRYQMITIIDRASRTHKNPIDAAMLEMVKSVSTGHTSQVPCIQTQGQFPPLPAPTYRKTNGIIQLPQSSMASQTMAINGALCITKCLHLC